MRRCLCAGDAARAFIQPIDLAFESSFYDGGHISLLDNRCRRAYYDSRVRGGDRISEHHQGIADKERSD